MRKDKTKIHPSGVSPNVAMSLHSTKYGAENCLQEVPKETVKEMLENLDGESLLAFVDDEYAAKAQQVYNSLGIANLSLTNVWDIFEAMLPLV
jgi:hypothetical protein